MSSYREGELTVDYQEARFGLGGDSSKIEKAITQYDKGRTQRDNSR